MVLTLRGDFVGHALAYRPLSDRLQDAQVNLGPMQRAELQHAIEQPAQKVGSRFDPGLITRILDDVDEEPGNLPLLEFVLQRLWDDATQHGGTLRHQAYEAMDGVAGALAQTAEGVYAKFSDIEKHAAQQVFLQLVRPAPSGDDTRRRATFSELGEATRALIKRLADARLVVTSREDVTKEETVEVAHEVLIRHWAQLKSWLNEDREFLLWRERLRGSRDAWVRSKQDTDALLRGTLLAEAERWLTQRRDLNDDERGYIAASVAARTKQQRKTRRLTVATVAIALAAAVAFALIAASAREQKALADKRLADARGVADKIVFTLDRDLRNIAGAAAVRGASCWTKRTTTSTRFTSKVERDDPTACLRMKEAALVQRGDLALSHDDLPQARNLYDEARVIAERLAQADPSNSEWQRDLSVSYYLVAAVARDQGNLANARKGFEKYLETMPRLVTVDSSNAGWRKDVLLGYEALLEVVPQKNCTVDEYLKAAEQTLAWFEQTKALAGDAEMPKIRDYFREYRAQRGNGSCTEEGPLPRR